MDRAVQEAYQSQTDAIFSTSVLAWINLKENIF